MQNKNLIKLTTFIVLAFAVAGSFFYFVLPKIHTQIKYNSENESADANVVSGSVASSEEVAEPIVSPTDPTAISPIAVTHIQTPKNVKALYISSWVAGSPKFRDSIIKIIDETEINSIVIDVKDSTGRVSFEMLDPVVKGTGSIEHRIQNIRALTDTLHKKNIYIIGRISVFQDPYMTKKNPSWSITKKSDGTVWKDRKGLSFLDPAKKEVHDYIVAIAKGAYSEGFDELNFDYIRYPSDGNMKDINYHLKEGDTRADNIEKFFKYLSTEIKKGTNIPISGDLFGLTTEVNDDMGIGQVWEKALPYFDYLAPMVYPSHYPAGHAGYKNPSAYPYEVINRALISAVKKTTAAGSDISKIRPWLQDFDLGSVYTKDMIRAEIKAANDNGINSWMMWDPSNKYTPSAFVLESVQ